MLRFTRVQTKRLYESVVEQFLELIADGKLELGQRLPTERELEKVMGVSRGVLREAFRVLEARGLIESRQGGGRFLRALPHEVTQIGLSPDIQLEQAAFLDYWEVREALESRAARLAALQADDGDCRHLLEQARNLLTIPSGTEEHVQADMEFHRSIASASKNIILMRLITDLLDVVSGMRARLIEKLVRSRTADDDVRDHLKIAQAITARKADLAETLIVEHLAVARRKYADTRRNPRILDPDSSDNGLP